MQHEGQTHSAGRIVRTLFAAIVLLVTAGMAGVKFVAMPLLTKTAIPDLPTGEAIFHIVMVVMAFTMLDLRTGKALVDKLVEKLPFGKGA